MWLRKPVLPVAVARAALVFLRCSTSLRLPLTLAKAAPCLVPRLRKPWRSCFARFGAALRLLAALGALRSPRGVAKPHSGFAFNVYIRTLIINLDVSIKAGYSIVDARFIARTLLSRQGWERLCGAGNADGFPPGGGDQQEAPRTGGRGQAQAQPAQNHGTVQAAFERTARPQGERSESRLVKTLRCERM